LADCRYSLQTAVSWAEKTGRDFNNPRASALVERGELVRLCHMLYDLESGRPD
jgi:hypothetical protein